MKCILRQWHIAIAGALLALILCACGQSAGGGDTNAAGMERIGQMDLAYAQEFRVDYYDGGYDLISIEDSQYLLVPEGAAVPADIDDDVTILQQPLDHLYVASSSAVDLFLQADAIEQVTMTSTSVENWTIPEIRERVLADDILYVGKYSAPDYEVVLDEGCDLVIENTMITHSPEVKEMLEQLGIPVLVERSSYEESPLGRVEWIKLYGLLTGHLEEAEAFFEQSVQQVQAVEQETTELETPDLATADAGTTDLAAADAALTDSGTAGHVTDAKGTRPTVAFFYFTSAGYVNVRTPGDYISQMIELAGGSYAFTAEELGDQGSRSTINMDPEQFYAAARDADILIYNSTVEGEIDSLDTLLDKSALLADCKAVSTGNVWCTGQNMFQQVSGTAQMIQDLHAVIAGNTSDPLQYLYHLQ